MDNIIYNDAQLSNSFQSSTAKQGSLVTFNLINHMFEGDSTQSSINAGEVLENKLLELIHIQIKPLRALLKKYSLGHLDDFANQKTLEINLSWPIVRYLSYGAGALAHELSHLVSAILFDLKGKGIISDHDSRNINIWNKRACVDRWHYKKPDHAVKVTRHHEYKYTEEDWSDYFAGHIIKEMKRESSWIKNYVCIISSTEHNPLLGHQFKDVDSVWHHHILKVNKYFWVSNSLFRAINIQKIMGETMPSSCQKIIDREKLFACPGK